MTPAPAPSRKEGQDVNRLRIEPRIVTTWPEYLAARAKGEKVTLRRYAYTCDQEETQATREQNNYLKLYRKTKGWSPNKNMRHRYSIPFCVMYQWKQQYGEKEVYDMLRREDPIVREYLLVSDKIAPIKRASEQAPVLKIAMDESELGKS